MTTDSDLRSFDVESGTLESLCQRLVALLPPCPSLNETCKRTQKWCAHGWEMVFFGIMFTTLAPSCPFLKLLIPTIQRNAPSQRSTDLESPDCTAIGSGCTHVFERLLAGYEHFSPLTESIFFTTCMQRKNHLCS